MKDFKKLIREAHLGNPLNEDGFKKNKDSYIKISEPSFRKDKNNPNFLSAYIKYDTGPGVGIALGKETMAGQIRRLSSAEALRQMEIIGRKLNDSYDLEDLDINDLENGVVELFAVSDDFIGMDPRSELSMAMLEENIDKKYSDFLVALRDSGATNMFGAAPYLQAEFGLDKREAREVLANWMRSFGESLKENQKYDDEDIVIYDGEEHIIMRKDGNMVYIRPLEDSAILGKRDEIKVPARALAYKSDLDKMYDEYKPKDEMNEVDEKWDKIARDEYGKPWMELSIAQKQEMLSYANRETEKQFKTDYTRRSQGDYSDDMKDGMTDYQRGRMDESVNKKTLGDLVKTYGKDLIKFVIGIDELTKDEAKDAEYLDDRIQIHLEEPEIRQKYLPMNESDLDEGDCGCSGDCRCGEDKALDQEINSMFEISTKNPLRNTLRENLKNRLS